jgi:HEAT repeat protein
METSRQSLVIALFFCLGTPLVRAADATDTELEVAQLTRRLTTSSNIAVRLAAIGKLAALDSHDGRIVRALCQAMLDPMPEVRSRAASLLEKIGSDIYWPVRSLTRGDESFNHPRAIAALAKMGEAAAPATPVLLFHATLSYNELVLLKLRARSVAAGQRQRHVAAQWHINDNLEQFLGRVLQRALNKLQDPPDEEELQAIRERLSELPGLIAADLEALAEAGSGERGLSRLIAQGLLCEELTIRLASVRALRSLGGTSVARGKAAAWYLATGLRDPEADVRLATVRALGELDGSARIVRNSLVRAGMVDHSEEVRLAAQRVVAQLDERAGN